MSARSFSASSPFSAALLFEPIEGSINHHWTKGLVASPDGAKLYAKRPH
jgi:glucose/arabinose dehydrogenase